MKAICISIFRDSVSVPENKCNFDNSGQASCHQCVTKCGMDHSTKWQMLWVCRHSPAGDENDKSRYEVPLWCSVSFPAQPDARQTCCPPDNTHCSMLDVIRNPGSAPSVFREGVDASPSCDNCRIKEFLRSSSTFQPSLSHQHDNCEHDAIPDECAPHNEMGKTLS